MAKWGIICRVCDRLLWVRDKPFKEGERMLSEGVRHAQTGEPAKDGDVVQWCHCKGRIGQQQLVESDNVDQGNQR